MTGYGVPAAQRWLGPRVASIVYQPRTAESQALHAVVRDHLD
jgi:hypothetical protein